MESDLRLFVMGHRHSETMRHARDTSPPRHTRRNRGVHVENVDRSAGYEIPAPMTGDFPLARVDRNADRAHTGVALDLLVPAKGFLEPRQVQVSNTACEFHRVFDDPRLVRVRAQVKLRSADFPCPPRDR